MQLAIPLDVHDLHYFVDLFTNVSKSATGKEQGKVVVNYDLNWELPTVLSKGFQGNYSAKEIVVINGQVIDAQITKSAQYVSQQWKLAMPLLDALDAAATKGVKKFST